MNNLAWDAEGRILSGRHNKRLSPAMGGIRALTDVKRWGRSRDADKHPGLYSARAGLELPRELWGVLPDRLPQGNCSLPLDVRATPCWGSLVETGKSQTSPGFTGKP